MTDPKVIEEAQRIAAQVLRRAFAGLDEVLAAVPETKPGMPSSSLERAHCAPCGGEVYRVRPSTAWSHYLPNADHAAFVVEPPRRVTPKGLVSVDEFIGGTPAEPEPAPRVTAPSPEAVVEVDHGYASKATVGTVLTSRMARWYNALIAGRSAGQLDAVVTEYAGRFRHGGVVRRVHVPSRFSDVAEWIRRRRDAAAVADHGVSPIIPAAWDALDDLLDDYNDRADAGQLLVPSSDGSLPTDQDEPDTNADSDVDPITGLPLGYQPRPPSMARPVTDRERAESLAALDRLGPIEDDLAAVEDPPVASDDAEPSEAPDQAGPDMQLTQFLLDRLPPADSEHPALLGYAAVRLELDGDKVRLTNTSRTLAVLAWVGSQGVTLLPNDSIGVAVPVAASDVVRTPDMDVWERLNEACQSAGALPGDDLSKFIRDLGSEAEDLRELVNAPSVQPEPAPTGVNVAALARQLAVRLPVSFERSYDGGRDDGFSPVSMERAATLLEQALRATLSDVPDHVDPGGVFEIGEQSGNHSRSPQPHEHDHPYGNQDGHHHHSHVHTKAEPSTVADPPMSSTGASTWSAGTWTFTPMVSPTAWAELDNAGRMTWVRHARTAALRAVGVERLLTLLPRIEQNGEQMSMVFTVRNEEER